MMRSSLATAAISMAMFLAACGGNPATGTALSPTPTANAPATSSASATPAATTAQLVAVAQAIFIKQQGYVVPCDLTGNTTKCPITDRLRARLTAATRAVNADVLCRCQNPASSLSVTATPTSTGGIDHVVLGYTPPITMDLVIVRSGNSLLVDDESCTGEPGTSIYTYVGPCPK